MNPLLNAINQVEIASLSGLPIGLGYAFIGAIAVYVVIDVLAGMVRWRCARVG